MDSPNGTSSSRDDVIITSFKDFLQTRLDKTSFKCDGNSQHSAEDQMPKRFTIRRRKRQVAVLESTLDKEQETESGNSSLLRKDHYEYLPALEYYLPYGQHHISEGRGWITVPLFILFSIIQFKLVSAIFLALFGPMILFLLIVQGFLFKATLILLGYMMT